MFSNVVVTNHNLRVFLYLFSSANISPIRFFLHLQDKNESRKLADSLEACVCCKICKF